MPPKTSFRVIASLGRGVVFAFLLFFAACGDETTENITNINKSSVSVVSSVDSLPKCMEENEGEQVFVKGESAVRICVDGKWLATSSGNADFSCKAEELKDGSGLKIVCNGDSIGVVLNGYAGKDGSAGKDGEDGKNGSMGADCSISGKTDSTVTVTCGDSTIILFVGDAMGTDFMELDSERVAVSLDSLVGYTQKGPFLKGSAVYLYELSDGRTLKQTNGNFSSLITSDNGRYKFTARDLVSQYAMVLVEGRYRNEVTGEPSNAKIRLRAITDLRKHRDANVNLLTHLEYDRVYYLVTREKKTVKQAKRQAQKEILKQFHIELDENTDAEDLNVFGSNNADAALLAISILLQRNSNPTDLSVLATEIMDAIAQTGRWEGEKAAAIKASIADWAMDRDLQGLFANYRKHVEDWGFSTSVPHFEIYIRRFAGIESGLGVCGSDSVPVGTVKNVTNEKSIYYASSYTNISDKGGAIRFICVDVDSAKWRLATDLEKDRFNWNSENKRDGALLKGLIAGSEMVWDADTLRLATLEEQTIKKGCVSYIRGSSYVTNFAHYNCSTDGWKLDVESSSGKVKDADGKEYRTVSIGFQNWMAENLNYATEGSYCYNDAVDNCSKYGRLYTWNAAKTACPSGWHLPSYDEWNTLITAVGGRATADLVLKSTFGWSGEGNGTDAYGFSVIPAGYRLFDEYVWGNALFWSSTVRDSNSLFFVDFVGNYGGVDLGVDLSVMDMGVDVALPVRCLQDNEIAANSSSSGKSSSSVESSSSAIVSPGIIGNLTDSRDGLTYKTVTIGMQTWMAENLNYEAANTRCYENNVSNCTKYGRLYTWATAMDSIGMWSSNGKGCGYGKVCSPTYPVRGVCPEGWHLPNNDEWNALFEAVGGPSTAGKILKSMSGWKDDGNGTDAFGFAAFPSGYMIADDLWTIEGYTAVFWSSTDDEFSKSALHLSLNYNSDGVDLSYWPRNLWCSVRCVKD